MSAIQDGLMELSYEASPNILSVKWSDELSVESDQFLQTLVTLFAAIQEKKVTNLIIDSGVPAGGVLTENIMNYFIEQIHHTTLQNIAILESPDYLWDNNLYQVIALLISTYHLPIAVRLVKSHAAGHEWLTKLEVKKTAKAKAV